MHLQRAARQHFVIEELTALRAAEKRVRRALHSGAKERRAAAAHNDKCVANFKLLHSADDCRVLCSLRDAVAAAQRELQCAKVNAAAASAAAASTASAGATTATTANTAATVVIAATAATVVTAAAATTAAAADHPVYAAAAAGDVQQPARKAVNCVTVAAVGRDQISNVSVSKAAAASAVWIALRLALL